MIRTQIYLPDDLYNDLKLLAQTGNKNISQLIREGAKILLEKKAKKKKFDPWKDFIGKGKGGPKDLSKNLDHYLYEETSR
ncbi:hypothetical protein BH10PAT1_BH10PAT1_1360 [soil metagenome]